MLLVLGKEPSQSIAPRILSQEMHTLRVSPTHHCLQLTQQIGDLDQTVSRNFLLLIVGRQWSRGPKPFKFSLAHSSNGY